MIGKKFGRWTVVEQVDRPHGTTSTSHFWRCRCDCGNEGIVSTNSLNMGKSQSCGCYAKEQASTRTVEDISGQRFGKLIVIKRVPKPENLKSNGAYWLCQCDCGKEKIIMGKSLRNGKTTSCGCRISEVARVDITGNKYGKLTILRYYCVSNSSSGHALWECQCECGNICIANSTSLKSGSTKSCGCLNSQGEEEIKKLLTANNIIFKREHTFSDLRYKGLLRFDFAIFDNNNSLILLCEYDGEQHQLKESKYFDNEIQLRDNLKNEYCQSNNIPLVRIPYTKLNNITLEDIFKESFPL